MKFYTKEQIEKKINKKNRKRIILKIIFYPILSIIFLGSIYLSVQRLSNPEKIADLFGFKIFTIISGSMEPTIKIGDVIIVKNVKTENDIKVDDIIAYSEQKSIITHRVIEIKETDGRKAYVTQGDNNNAADEETIGFGRLEGVMVAILPKLGKVFSYAHNTTILITVFAIIFIYYKITSRKEDREIARHEKRKKLEKDEEEYDNDE